MIVLVCYDEIGVGKTIIDVINVYHLWIDPAIARSRNKNMKSAKFANSESSKFDRPEFRWLYYELCFWIYDSGVEGEFLDTKIATGYKDFLVGC